MPVVDKLPVLLREDLESAFRDDLDNVFDITHLQQSLGQRKRDLEIELKRVSSVFCTVFRCRIICVDFFNTSCLLMSLSCPLCCFVLQMLRLKEKFRQIHEQLSTEQVRSWSREAIVLGCSRSPFYFINSSQILKQDKRFEFWCFVWDQILLFSWFGEYWR